MRVVHAFFYTMLVGITLLYADCLLAKYDGPPSVYAEWFKKQLIPGTPNPCCDESDGFRTDFEIRGDKYWFPIKGAWYEVPGKAVITNSRNPTGSAVVWFTFYESETPYIRCFAPGAEI